MIKNKDEIEAKLQELQSEINKNMQSDSDPRNLTNDLISVLDLAGGMVSYLNTQNSLTSWSKEHIICAVNALNWHWFNLALNQLSLALCVKNEISPTVVYSEEITKLSADKIINHINSFKNRLG